MRCSWLEFQYVEEQLSLLVKTWRNEIERDPKAQEKVCLIAVFVLHGGCAHTDQSEEKT